MYIHIATNKFELSGGRFPKFRLLVAKILHVCPEIRNLHKDSTPEPDSEVQILRSKPRNATTKTYFTL